VIKKVWIRPSQTVIVLATMAAVVAGMALPVAGQPAQSHVVSDNPVDWTPHVLDGTVYSLTSAGSLVVAGGDFTGVSDPSGGQVFGRGGVFGWDSTTNAITGLHVDVDGPVYAVQAGPDGTVYLGGKFKTVNGMPSRGLAQVRLTDGATVSSFTASVDYGDVRVLRRWGPWLYVGGSFTAVSGWVRPGLARLALDGTVDTSFDAGLQAPRGQRAKVNDLVVTSGGNRLVIVGGFSSVQGLPRRQVAVLGTDDGGVWADGWHTDAYRGDCSRQFETYIRAVDLSPDDSFFVVVTTGHRSAPHLLCNTAARFDLAGTGRHDPVWINHTGGNTLHAVAVTGAAVYVGGHQQWLDNPHGDKHAGPGAVARQGIGAIGPESGQALAWNPGRSRGVGVRAFLSTPQGLWVGSDTERLGGEYHGRLGMFPVLPRMQPPPRQLS
jgi:hypothetical protein